jgi:hypothetical protein
MDDGYEDRGNFRFATESFSRDVVLLLLEVLKENFSLDCSLNRSNLPNTGSMLKPTLWFNSEL